MQQVRASRAMRALGNSVGVVPLPLVAHIADVA